MAHTFDELVEMQRAADHAQTQVQQLRDQYGPPTAQPWSEQQTETYETALRAWRDLARDVQAAVTEYAQEQGVARFQAEEDVKSAVRHARPEAEGDIGETRSAGTGGTDGGAGSGGGF
ncbi:hypothetical protein ACIQNG_21245 [Streptomyces sp. NPDC091377]|uniref:hypothetical protein n=1 Tax=unclassified Streptomyces TaxID=2593676 RepID=UPI00381D5897